MKFSIEFEYPRPDNPNEGKVAALARMMFQARQALRKVVTDKPQSPEAPPKRGPGRPRKSDAALRQ